MNRAAAALADEIKHDIGSELFCRRALSIRSILRVVQGGAVGVPRQVDLKLLMKIVKDKPWRAMLLESLVAVA